MAVPDTTPVTVVLPASLIPTVTSLTSPAPTAARLTTVVQSAPPVNPIRIAVRRRFPVTTDVPRPTPAVSVLLVRATRIVTCPINLVTADALPQTPVANALPASPVRLQTLVPAFPAALTPIVPVALATATPGITSRVLPVLKTRYILTATVARRDTQQPILGEVRLRPRPRPVLAVLLREPVTKPRRTLTATAVPAGIVKLKLQEVAKQHLNVVLVVQLLERVIENLFVQMLEPLIEIIQPQYVHYL